jgi:hypothetical protein
LEVTNPDIVGFGSVDVIPDSSVSVWVLAGADADNVGVGSAPYRSRSVPMPTLTIGAMEARRQGILVVYKAFNIRILVLWLVEN